jgi:hypothetical protein
VSIHIPLIYFVFLNSSADMLEAVQVGMAIAQKNSLPACIRPCDILPFGFGDGFPLTVAEGSVLENCI